MMLFERTTMWNGNLVTKIFNSTKNHPKIMLKLSKLTLSYSSGVPHLLRSWGTFLWRSTGGQCHRSCWSQWWYLMGRFKTGKTYGTNVFNRFKWFCFVMFGNYRKELSWLKTSCETSALKVKHDEKLLTFWPTPDRQEKTPRSGPGSPHFFRIWAYLGYKKNKKTRENKNKSQYKTTWCNPQYNIYIYIPQGFSWSALRSTPRGWDFSLGSRPNHHDPWVLRPGAILGQVPQLGQWWWKSDNFGVKNTPTLWFLPSFQKKTRRLFSQFHLWFSGRYSIHKLQTSSHVQVPQAPIWPLTHSPFSACAFLCLKRLWQKKMCVKNTRW